MCHVQDEGVSVMYQLQYLGNYLADYAETLQACRHPPGNVSLCVTIGVRLHVRTCKATVVSDLENGWTDRAQTLYIDEDRLVKWRAKVNWDYLARALVQGDGSRSRERLDRLRSNLVHG